MKKRNTYYQETFARPAILKKLILSGFLGLSYYFRVPIEVITRQNLGERYFNLLLTAAIGLGLICFPVFASTGYDGDINYEKLFKFYTTWYIYTGLYLYCSYLRWNEIRTLPSVWDMERFSLSTGTPIRFFYQFRVRKENQNSRFTATILEPGVFLVVGILLTLWHQPIGPFFICCAIVYSLGYTAGYYLADQFVMDKIDQTICNEDMYNIFVNDIPSERGFEFHAKRPKDKESREKLYNDYVDAEVVQDEPQVVS